MCEFETTLRELDAEWHVESGLVSACIPQARGGEVRLSIERLDGGGWDWVVWRVGAPAGDPSSGGVWSGVAPHRCDALLAVQAIARRIRLAPHQNPTSTTAGGGVAAAQRRVA
ncbi:hypothetical protein [Acidisphaera rubrifaciens]|uniref:Uncharacterized protein n=1 Tax=Acidisphaera rubrifaciens HS-AP3 TaxID=1231350 RepID=A0A0D6P516_9PROT|nr:hypothetical protein [Acidisphaera rubrifaciens]GAN75984.1 hypothetical protein Asru_0037_06 [Acidisphaera rubrifaciens HS-AP3]